MKKINILFYLLLLSGSLLAAETWDLMDKSMTAWNASGGTSTNGPWTYSKASNAATNSSLSTAVTQQNGSVNITKTYAYYNYNYAFLVSPAMTMQTNTAYTVEIKARLNQIDKNTYPDVTPPTSAGTVAGFESNQLTARLNNKALSIHLKYGGENEGYVSIGAGLTHADEEKYLLNTSEWHTYRFVFHADNLKYDVYIDGGTEPVFENVPAAASSGTNILKLGAESIHRCNMDIEHAKVGTGDFCSKPKITSVLLSSDSHVQNHERTVSVSINSTLINAGEKLTLSFVDKNSVDVIAPAEVTVSGNTTTVGLTIPASVQAGKYEIKVSAPSGTIAGLQVNPKGIQYVVVEESPIATKILPQVNPIGFVTDINNYVYKAPSNEFIFPAIVDAKKHTTNGKFLNGQDTVARYYRFYTPHENPGGMFLATGSSLDGPWTERNTVINLDWTRTVPNNVINTASHISACQVVWNAEFNKFFMYFHGPNTTTHYATSDNLINWIFGGSVVEAKQFSSTGTEASYARVFEHEIPGLGNKYIMLLMIMEGNRKIYWAHSTDGVSWIPVRKPLISPDLNYKKVPGTDVKPNYTGSMGSNVSGPYFMEVNGRCFVFCHGSSGNICVVEVGESLDMEVHWGEYMQAVDVVIDTDDSGNSTAVPRVAAPEFIQNDAGKWYMFFEAGGRLGANIAYAKENDISTSVYSVSKPGSAVAVYPTLLKKGQQITITDHESKNLDVEIYNLLGRKLYSSRLENETGKIQIHYPTGVYIVKVKVDGSFSYESKIVVTE
jgi:hypothetical protein